MTAALWLCQLTVLSAAAAAPNALLAAAAARALEAVDCDVAVLTESVSVTVLQLYVPLAVSAFAALRSRQLPIVLVSVSGAPVAVSPLKPVLPVVSGALTVLLGVALALAAFVPMAAVLRSPLPVAAGAALPLRTVAVIVPSRRCGGSRHRPPPQA
eukprot:PhM_4_TR13825/c0_g1_i1/m.67165